MAEIDLKFMKGDRKLARDIGLKIKPDNAAKKRTVKGSKAKKKR